MNAYPPQDVDPEELAGSDLVVLEERIPGTRQVAKLVFVLVLVAVFVVGSGDPVIAAIALVIGLWMLAHDLFSVFGWEHLVVTEKTLRIERRLFGRVLKRIEIDRARIESLEFVPRPGGLERFDDAEDRDQDVWSFGSGPIVIETDTAIYRLGQGLIRDRQSAKDVADRLGFMLSLPRRG